MPRIRLASPLRTFPALLLALGLVPAAANAASPPTISKVSPMKIEVGQTLTISGKGFIPGKGTNTVVFKRDGKAAVFVKADSATATRIVLKVPTKVTPFLKGKDGNAAPQKFRLRVLARKFGKAFTSNKLSPQIGPPGAFSDTGSVPGCKPDFKSAKDSDSDGTPDAQEKTYKTDPCKADTDGDGVSDTFEIESALDLNSRALPYAGKRPYPNALDGGDAGIDFDGDGLSLIDEYSIWMYTTAGGKLPLTYSDGDQDTNVDGSNTPSNGSALDMNGDGYLTDDEKDADGDGLSNWDESHGRLTASWWANVFQSTEKPFAGGNGAQLMSELSPIDPDTDGDGLPDGADDQDQDGYSNLQELDRHYALTPGGLNLWVNPYNPCLPDPNSRTCSLHPPLAEPWAPFPLTPGYTTPLTTTHVGPGPGFIPKI